MVPPGSFMMGSPASEAGRDDDEGPVHRVTIGYSLAVGVYEVTFGELYRRQGYRGDEPRTSGDDWRRPAADVSDGWSYA